MADLQSTVVTGTFEATQGFTNITEASFTTKVTAPLMVGVGNVVQMENKSDAGSRGTIDIDATGNINLGGDGGVINVNKAMVYGALDFTVDTDTLYVDAANDRVGVNIAPSEAMHVSGNSVATGDVVSNYSDVRLKKNIIGIDSALNKVNGLRGVTYDFNNKPEIGFEPTRKSDHGLIAHEVQEVLPHAVTLAPFDLATNGGSKSGDSYLTIRYERVIPLLVEAIKELSAKLEKLENKN